MKTISLKLEDKILEKIQEVMKEHHYTTQTEFIREALREKLRRLELRGKVAPKEGNDSLREYSL